MAQINTREICLLQSTTATTNGIGPDINLLQGWQAAIVTVNVSAVSGTSPTLNVFVQSKLGQAAGTDTSGGFLTGTAIYDDTLAFTQLTTTGNQIARPIGSSIVAGTSGTSGSLAVGVDYLQKDAALTAGNYRLGAIGGLWRVKYTIAGTSPSFTFSVVAQLIPFGS